MPSVNVQIFIGAALGILLGLLAAYFGADSSYTKVALYSSTIVGNFFVDLLKMVLVPLVFSTIVVGVANLRAHQNIHRVWITTISFFIFSMSIAMLLALGVMNFFEPGQGLRLDMFKDAMANFESKKVTPSEFFIQFLHGLFQNPFAALAKGDVLPTIIFAVFLGVALVMGGEKYKNILALFQEFLDLMMRIIGWIMRVAPLGICALLLKLSATQNTELLTTLGAFVAIIVGTTLFHGLVILPGLVYLVARKSPLWFLRGSRDALLTAFATASSNATLPVTLRCVEQNLKVRPEVGGFVVPLGATINMDGTALYEAAAALFIANLAGIDLSLSQQLIVFCTAMIAAMGAPGIPSAGMVTMIMVLQSVGLPVEAIAILLPIDRLLDTFRTTVNVEGDMAGSVIVQTLLDKNSATEKTAS